MATRVTVTLPDDTFRRAAEIARLTGREVADMLAETISLSLEPLGRQQPPAPPVEGLPDADLLAAAGARMDPEQDRRLSDLLDRQQAGQLQRDERAALLTLLGAYQDGLLLKARATQVAAQRGLLPPLTP